MSRSKREPIATQGYGGVWRKEAKRKAARKVRAKGDVPDGAAYKKEFNHWNICDWKIPMKKGDPKARRK